MRTPPVVSSEPARSSRRPIAHRSRNFRAQSGQSLVEVALITPLLLAMLLGAIELGRYAYISILVGNAARAGAAYGSQSLPQSGNTAGIQRAADNDFQNNGQKVSDLTVTSWNSCGCDLGGTLTYQGTSSLACTTGGNASLDTTCSGGSGGHYVVTVSVQAAGTFYPMFKYPWIPSQLTVSRTSTMRVAE
jgi:Flp pilus assembly protein TadG